MPRIQFARVHAYSAQKAAGVLAEADRVPEASGHVDKPRRPIWTTGGVVAVRQALDAHMQTGADLRMKDGRVVQRRRHTAHRCLVAGSISHPLTMRQVDADTRALQQVKAWARDTLDWLRRQYTDRLVAACLHLDESHPHLHFFVVGDAQRLHPGMKAEIDPRTGKRSRDNVWRISQHKTGLKGWLDDYHRQVGAMHQLQRSTGARPAWRIKDRALRSQVIEMRRQVFEVLDVQQQAQMQAQLDDMYDDAEKTPRPRMRF